jgi:hypothetical protein
VPDVVRILKKVHTTGLPETVADVEVAALKWGAIYFTEGSSNLLGRIAHHVLLQVAPEIIDQADRARAGCSSSAQALLARADDAVQNGRASTAMGYSVVESLGESAQPRPAQWSDDYFESVLEPLEIKELEESMATGINWAHFPSVRTCAVKPVPHPDGAHTEAGDIIPSDGVEPNPPPDPAAIARIQREFDNLTAPGSTVVDGDGQEGTSATAGTRAAAAREPATGPTIQMDTIVNSPGYLTCLHHKNNAKWNSNYDERFIARVLDYGPLELQRYVAAMSHGQTREQAQEGTIPWTLADRNLLMRFVEAHPETGYAIVVRAAQLIHKKAPKAKANTGQSKPPSRADRTRSWREPNEKRDPSQKRADEKAAASSER